MATSNAISVAICFPRECPIMPHLVLICALITNAIYTALLITDTKYTLVMHKSHITN